MAVATVETITILRETAQRLSDGAIYNWCHQGSCNCGHLAQTVTKKTSAEIHALAIERYGEWQDHVREFSTVVEAEEFYRDSIDVCSMTGLTVEHIMQSIIEKGFCTDDLYHLEKLSHPTILARIPIERKKNLQYRKREDVILYLETWASILQETYIEKTELSIPVENTLLLETV